MRMLGRLAFTVPTQHFLGRLKLLLHSSSTRTLVRATKVLQRHARAEETVAHWTQSLVLRHHEHHFSIYLAIQLFSLFRVLSRTIYWMKPPNSVRQPRKYWSQDPGVL